MKKKLFLVIVAALALMAKGRAQDTLQTSVGAFAANYPPGSNFSVVINYSVSGPTVENATITCTVPSSVNFVSAVKDTTYDTVIYNSSTRLLTFYMKPHLPATGASLSFDVQFPVGTPCNTTASFTDTFRATNVYQTAISSIATAHVQVATNLSWYIYPYATYAISQLGEYNSIGPSTTGASPANVRMYYNSYCGSADCGDDTLVLEVPVFNNGDADLNDAYVQLDFDHPGISVLNVFRDAACTQALPSGDITNGTSSCVFMVGNSSHVLQTSVTYYYYYVKLVVSAAYLNSALHLALTPGGNNSCDGAAYTGTTFNGYIKVIPQTGQECVFQELSDTYLTAGCSNSSGYAFYNRNECRKDCAGAFENMKLEVTVPSQVTLTSLTMPYLQGSDTVVLSGHYYCNGTGPLSFGPYTYNASYMLSHGDVLSLSQLVPGCSPANVVIADYTFTSNITSYSNDSVYFGNYNFNVSPSVPVSYSIPFKYRFTSSTGTYSCGDSVLWQVSANPSIGLYNYYTCNQKSCYNIGDTVEYTLAFENLGNGAFAGGRLTYTLPQGLQYVANSAVYKLYSGAAGYRYYSDFCTVADTIGTPVTDITPDASSTTASLLVWNLPNIAAYCNRTGDVYLVKLKAIVTNAALYGDKVSQVQVANDQTAASASNTISVCRLNPSFTPVKEVSTDGVNWVMDTTVVETEKGAALQYRITITNNGTVPLGHIKLVDILPSNNDDKVIDCAAPRGSNTFISLTTPLLTTIHRATVQYSTSMNPPRGTLLNFTNPDLACESGTWDDLNSSTNVQAQHAFKIDFGDSVLLPGEKTVYIYSAQVPAGTPANKVAYNSFGATATVQDQTNNQLIGSESHNVRIKIDSADCQCIGHFVWLDSNRNGKFDGGEQGLNGVSLQLYNAVTNEAIGLPHISSYDVNGTPGFYQYCNLPEGSYYIAVLTPDSYVVGPPATAPVDPDNHNDADPGTLKTSVFTVTCGQPENDTINIGVVSGDKCDQSCTGRKVIYFKNILLTP